MFGWQNDVRSKTEESQYLRESLHQTRDRLDQEKRLNTAIKQRKVLARQTMLLCFLSNKASTGEPRNAG